MDLRTKIKKALLSLCLSGLASWGVFTPLIASAGFFSLGELLSSVASHAQGETNSPALNSQNIPLLTSIININPKPIGGGDIAVVAGSALLAEAGPSGTLVDLANEPSSTAISVYTVHEGDTLSTIAEMFDVSVNTIVWANDLQGKKIHPGDVLVILPITGLRVAVGKGDTVASIAKKYKADAEEIARYNDLAADATLAVGTTIIIPEGEVVAPPVPVKAKPKATTPLRGAGGPAIAGYYLWPVDGGVVTQGLHGYNGIDIGAPRGTSVFASAAGTVIIARGSGYNGGYGSYVVVQHDNGTQTLYGHLSRVSVSAGTRVAQGAALGAVGSTGKSTGNHLHFEVRGATNPFR